MPCRHDVPPPAPGSEPDLSAEPGWEPWSPLRIEGGLGSFVSGEPRDHRLRLVTYRRVADGRLVAKAWFGPGAQGPPGHAHGGSMVAVLDEIMGAAAWGAGHRVVAVSLTTDFRRLLPLGSVVHGEGWVTSADGRKVHTAGRLTDPSGTAWAEATGLFLEVDPKRFAALLSGIEKADGGKQNY